MTPSHPAVSIIIQQTGLFLGLVRERVMGGLPGQFSRLATYVMYTLLSQFGPMSDGRCLAGEIETNGLGEGVVVYYWWAVFYIIK